MFPISCYYFLLCRLLPQYSVAMFPGSCNFTYILIYLRSGARKLLDCCYEMYSSFLPRASLSHSVLPSYRFIRNYHYPVQCFQLFSESFIMIPVACFHCFCLLLDIWFILAPIWIVGIIRPSQVNKELSQTFVRVYFRFFYAKRIQHFFE